MENVEDNKKSKKKLIITIAVVLIVVIGITYAYFRIRKETEAFSATTGGFNVSFANNSMVSLTNAYPLIEEEIEDKSYKNVFTLSNNGSQTIYAKIDLTNIVLSNEFQTSPYDIKWALYEGDTKLTTGSFASVENSKVNIVSSITLDSGASKQYTLRIWINETPNDQNNLQEGTLTGKITASANVKSSNTLASKILGNNNSNVITTSPSFEIGSTSSGLYVEKDNSEKSNFGFPTYYYRGNTKYVQFGTYKSDVSNYGSVIAHAGDPILWEIVRINEDGSIRLATFRYVNDEILWNTNSNISLYTNSTIESVMNEWYNTHMYDVSNNIVIGDFCNDISQDYNGARNRLKSIGGQSFVCPNTGKIINSKVGVISADEMIYSGAISIDTISDPYDKGNSFFDEELTMTPYSKQMIFINFTSEGYYLTNAFLNETFISPSGEDPLSARAIINLKGDVTVSGGTGEKSTPYIIN